jgi:uncharacterized membrane protein
MSGLSRAIGFYVVSFVPMTHSRLQNGGGDSHDFFHAAVTTAVVAIVFGIGGLLGSLMSGKKGRNSIAEIIFGGTGAVLAWSLLFAMRKSSGGEVEPLAQLGVVFGVGMVVVFTFGRQPVEA